MVREFRHRLVARQRLLEGLVHGPDVVLHPLNHSCPGIPLLQLRHGSQHWSVQERGPHNAAQEVGRWRGTPCPYIRLAPTPNQALVSGCQVIEMCQIILMEASSTFNREPQIKLGASHHFDDLAHVLDGIVSELP